LVDLMQIAYSIFETCFYQQRIPQPRHPASILQFINDIKIFKICPLDFQQCFDKMPAPSE